MSNHHIPIKMARIQRLTTASISEDVEELEHSYTADDYVKLYNHFEKQFDNFLKS